VLHSPKTHRIFETSLTQNTYTMKRFAIHHDFDPMNPREWDNLGTLFEGRSFSSIVESVAYDECEYDAPDECFDEDDEIIHDKLMEHFEQRFVYTDPFIPCRDARAHVLYCPIEDARKNWNLPDTAQWDTELDNGETLRSATLRILEGEEKEYTQWAEGDCYGFTAEVGTHCECCDTVKWETQESVWGFYGPDAPEHMKEHLTEEWHELVDEAQKVFLLGEYTYDTETAS